MQPYTVIMEGLEKIKQAQAQIEEAHRDIWSTLKKSRKYFERREFLILKMRLHERQSLEEVATYFGVTRERIRQKETALLDKLKVIEQ